MTEAPSPFSSNIPNFQTHWDSTSLGWLKECPTLYKTFMIDKLSPKSRGVHLAFGGWYASGVEHYAHYRASGDSHDTATLKMVRWVLENSGSRDENGVWTAWSPGDHKDANIKNRYTLIRSLVWNVEDRQGSPFKTVILASGKPAVELTFDFKVFEIEGEEISLSGHMDELVEAQGQYWFKDDKAQPVFCDVLTPTGWKKIGELVIGEKIAGRDGNFHKINDILPKGTTPAFSIEFEDNSQTFCALDHLWDISISGQDVWKTVDTTELIRLVHKSSYRVHVPLCSPIQHAEAKLPVDPYLLGVLLGDGYLGGNSVSLSTANEELIISVQAAVDRMGDILRKSPSNNLVWTITNKRNCATLKGLKTLNLWGCLSSKKFVPPLYVFAAEWQRRAILQGLLDTDGSWAGRERRYQTMSRALAQDVASLVRSLGGTASITLQPRKMYRVSIRLGERNTSPHRRFVKSVTRIKDCETVCIATDAPDKLYVTDDYIVTHNTTKGALGANYFSNFTPNNQMTLYTIAGKVILDAPIRGGLVRAAQIGVNFTRFQTAQIPRPEAVLTEWLDDAKYWITQARSMALANYWPRNDKSCDKFGGCPLRRVCAVSPSHREAWLKEDFVIREWNPLQARGEI